MAFLKHKHCSHTSSVGLLFMHVNYCRQQEFSWSFIYMFSESPCYRLIFIRVMWRLSSSFFYIIKLINSLREYLQAFSVVQGFRLSYWCPIALSPYWYRRWRTAKAIYVMIYYGGNGFGFRSVCKGGHLFYKTIPFHSFILSKSWY